MLCIVVFILLVLSPYKVSGDKASEVLLSCGDVGLVDDGRGKAGQTVGIEIPRATTVHTKGGLGEVGLRLYARSVQLRGEYVDVRICDPAFDEIHRVLGRISSVRSRMARRDDHHQLVILGGLKRIVEGWDQF